MDKAKGKNGVEIHKMIVDDIHIKGNQMNNDLFFNLAHTPLHLGETHNSKEKIIICLSRHDFKINEHNLKASGLVARDNQESCHNIQTILDKEPSSIVLVSKKAKKYYNKETLLENYRPRIFCLTNNKKGIINKIPGLKSNLYKIKTILL